MGRSKRIHAADLFCGAGGTSTGLAQACRDAGIEVDLLAINHWKIAIDSHAASHPWARHMCASLDHVRPQDVCPGGRLHLLVASPECTHHARARGGRPMLDQSRATAWHILKFAQELYIDNILIENVPEFKEWGPLGANGKPLKSRKGETFQAFIGALTSLGYRVEHRILNAADYGDPTTRRRLFVIARRGGKPIHWPAQTHSPAGAADLFGTTQPYRTARKSVIDWSLKNPSIFKRKKPLAPTTMARIIAGLRKFNPQLEPFIVTLRQHVTARSVEEPVPTISAGGTHLGLCEPFMVNMKGKSTARDIDVPLATQTTKNHQYLCEPFMIGQQSGAAPRSVEEPIPTVATAGAISLIEPFIVTANHGEDGPNSHDRRAHSVDEPLKTVTTENSFALVQPFMVQAGGPVGKARHPGSVDEPMPTVMTENHTAVVEPVLVTVTHGEGDDGRPRSMDRPLPTLTTHNGIGVAEAFILPLNRPKDQPRTVEEPLRTVTATSSDMGLVEPFMIPIDQQGSGEAGARTIDDPVPTITTENRMGLVEPFLTKYFSSGEGAHSVDEPLATVTTKDRFGLVMPVVNGQALDIRFRMLQPHELARAQGFPDDYKFTGNKSEIVKQIGNAVPVGLAKALCAELLKDYTPKTRGRAALAAAGD